MKLCTLLYGLAMSTSMVGLLVNEWTLVEQQLPLVGDFDLRFGLRDVYYDYEKPDNATVDDSRTYLSYDDLCEKLSQFKLDQDCDELKTSANAVFALLITMVVLTSICFLMAITYLAIRMRTHYLILPLNVISFCFVLTGTIVWATYSHPIIENQFTATLSWSFYGCALTAACLLISLIRIIYLIKTLKYQEIEDGGDTTVNSLFFSKPYPTATDTRAYGARF